MYKPARHAPCTVTYKDINTRCCNCNKITTVGRGGNTIGSFNNKPYHFSSSLSRWWCLPVKHTPCMHPSVHLSVQLPVCTSIHAFAIHTFVQEYPPSLPSFIYLSICICVPINCFYLLSLIHSHSLTQPLTYWHTHPNNFKPCYLTKVIFRKKVLEI